MMKNASFSTILEDLKVSFKFAVKNVFTYILALIGVVIVSLLLIVIVAAIIFIPLFFILRGFEGFTQFFDSFGSSITPSGITTIALGSFLFALPFLAPIFVAVGAMFGIGREIVESEGASAEGVFTWYKKKFFSLAGGGLILFLVVLGPLMLGLLAGTAIYGEGFLNLAFISSGSTSAMNSMLIALFTIWIIISMGILSMVFPSIIDGYSVLESAKQSIRMSIRYFDRVFGVWIAFVLVLLVLIAPILVMPFAFDAVNPTISPLGGFLIVYMIPAGIILLFLYMPALSIGLTRVYMILTADDDYEHTLEDEEKGPSFIGGV